MLGGGYYLYSKGQSAFDNKVTKRFPSGCTEVYINGNLTTEKCSEISNTTRTPSFKDELILGNITIDIMNETNINISEVNATNETQFINISNITNSS